MLDRKGVIAKGSSTLSNDGDGSRLPRRVPLLDMDGLVSLDLHALRRYAPAAVGT